MAKYVETEGDNIDPIWEEIHMAREWGKYPPEELIRFVARNYYERKRREVRLLDIGCGFGNAVWYYCLEGFSAMGVDGSAATIERLRRRLSSEGLSAELHVGDVTKCLLDLFEPGSIDAVTDLTCLYAMPTAAAKKAIADISILLRKGGRLFSMTFDVSTWGFGKGMEVGEKAYTDITEGPLMDRGYSRFYGREDLNDLYTAIPIVSVESTTRTMEQGRRSVKYWVTECAKL